MTNSVSDDVYNVNMAKEIQRVEPRGDRYHHGNLTAALVEAGLKLAAAGGPSEVTVRAAARDVGVSAPAAYRHFEDRDRFLAAVARHCRQQLAEEMIAARRRKRSPVERFKAVGRAYIGFAISNPHLAETAFSAGPDAVPDAPDAFAVLVESLDELCAKGILKADRREGAEIVAWSSVHGIALLLAKSHDGGDVSAAMAERVLLGIDHALGLSDG